MRAGGSLACGRATAVREGSARAMYHSVTPASGGGGGVDGPNLAACT